MAHFNMANQGSNPTHLEKQLERIHQIASSHQSHSKHHRARMINGLISSWRGSLINEPVVVLFPEKDQNAEYVFLQGVLYDGSHVVYVYAPSGRGQAMIINSLRHSLSRDQLCGSQPISINELQQRLFRELQNQATELDQNLATISSNTDDPDVKASIAKVRNLIEKTPQRIQDYLSKESNDTNPEKSLQIADTTNKIVNYMKMANNLLTSNNGSHSVPINGDILHNVTGQVLSSLRT